MKYINIKHPALICALLFAVYCIALGSPSIPITGDQKTYFSIALEMHERREWLIPYLFGEPNFLKPPFQYWMTLLGWKFFGLSVFGSLIPSVLALVASSFFVFKISEKINITRPHVAALLFAGCLGSMTYGSTAQMEIWVVCLYLGAWLLLLQEKVLLAFVVVGVMAWVKGPLYPALWTASALIWNFSMIKTKKFWAYLFLGSMIGLSWYFAAAKLHAEVMLKQFLYTENFSKLSTHQGSAVGLWNHFAVSLLPWLPLALIVAIKRSTIQLLKNNAKFYLAYLILPSVFFTFFPYRVNSYLYILTPVIAMIAAEVDFEKKSLNNRIAFILYGALFVLLSVIVIKMMNGGWFGAEIAISAILAFFVFMGGVWISDWKYVICASVLIVNLIRISAVQIGEKDFAQLKEYSNQNPGSMAYFIEDRDIWHEFGLTSMAIGKPVDRIFHHFELESYMESGGALILNDTQAIPNSKKVHCVEWNRLKRRTKFPIQKLIFEGVDWGSPEVTRVFKICSI